MKKMMQKLQENRKNNKGFTLVELIIVIAIIAVLAAVLAPQYIKYVEKSREAADKSTLSEIAQAMKITAADPDAKYAWTADGTVTISAATNGVRTVTGANGANFDTNLKAALGFGTIKLQSAKVADATSITFTIDSFVTAPATAATYAVTCAPSTGSLDGLWDGN